MNNSRAHKAFTIMEILIVVVIIGVIAAFAIPNYGRSVAQTHLQDAIIQLSAIRTANQVYYARTGAYWPPSGSNNVAAINSNLSLNIIENGMTYTCTGTGTAFSCTAVTPGIGSFTTTVTQAALSATNPQCTSGSACP
jgi:prepilin-type N-terminal cleavage/methylation domain-containing protein